MMPRIVTHNWLRDGSLENALCARGTDLAKNNMWRALGEILIVQSIQLGFLLLLGSATLNEANMSAMRRVEWTITARRAVLRLSHVKYQYFVPQR